MFAGMSDMYTYTCTFTHEGVNVEDKKRAWEKEKDKWRGNCKVAKKKIKTVEIGELYTGKGGRLGKQEEKNKEVKNKIKVK